MKRPFAMLRCIFTLALALATLPARAEQTIDITLAHGQRQNPFQVPLAAAAWKFKDSVESRTQGAIRVHIVPEGQAGADAQVPRLVKDNVVQAAFLPAAALVPVYPPIAVTLAPFATRNKAQAITLYDGAFGKQLAEDIKARTGIVVLGYAIEDGTHVLLNSRRPVRTPADMDGLRMGVPPGPGFAAPMLQALGATPLKMARSDAYTALEGGIIDGQAAASEQVVRHHWDEVQTFATLTDHRHAPVVWLFNQQSLDSLSVEHRMIVQVSAKAALAAARKLAAQQDTELAGPKVLGRYLDVTPLPAKTRDAFAAAARPAIAEEIEAQLGADGKLWLGRLMDAAEN